MVINHGPAFRNLIRSRILGHRSITEFSLSLAAAKGLEYLLHSVALDSIFQTYYFLFPSEVNTGDMSIPHSIGSMFIPHKLG